MVTQIKLVVVVVMLATIHDYGCSLIANAQS